MSNEFRVHHLVSELMNLLSVRPTEGSPGAEVYVDLLLKNMTPYITTQVSAQSAKRRIAEFTPTAVEFLAKYDELKSKNTRDLDPLVYLLSKLGDDPQVKSCLEKTAPGPPVTVSVPLMAEDVAASVGAGSFTQEELNRLKMKLLQSDAKPIVLTTDVLKKTTREKAAANSDGYPVQPDWLLRRPLLTHDFVLEGDVADNEILPVGNMPIHFQEAAIIDDLMYCAEGVEGRYIQPLPLADKYSKREFIVDQTLEPSLREEVRRILPMCSNYSTIVRFIEEKSTFEHGLVNHALSAAIRTIIKDYLILVTQLEQQNKQGLLTLQKFWFYIQPTMRIFEIIASIANSINRGNLKGGSVLGLLHEKTSSLIGDTKGKELCLFLTQSACVPYFEILQMWIYNGIIRDPYSEFVIEENNAFQKEKLQEDFNDAYWELHYTVCQDRIPVFLERVADKILNTGKYLNVVRECGQDVKCPYAEEIIYSIEERLYFEHIEKAYDFASKLLLDMLVDDKELMARLRSIKHYFLLDQGDFVVQFMDMADDEIKKPVDRIQLNRLETLLELALRTSTANIDPFKDDLKVALLPYDLVTHLFMVMSIDTKHEKQYKVSSTDLHLSGLEAFSFDYVVKWPLSLVVNRKALTRYQMLFRHLFYCKHVERQLSNVWVGNKAAKLFTLDSVKWYAMAFALRQRMINFVQNFEYYMTFEVIEPNWQQFEHNLNEVNNIDDVLSYHTNFLDNCLRECMLTTPDLLRIIHKLMMVCIGYCNFMQRLSHSASVDLDTTRSSSAATLQATQTLKDRQKEPHTKKTTTKVMLEHMDQWAGSEDFERTISTFDANFSRQLVALLVKIMELSSSNCEPKLMNIFYRLDFNNFYTKELQMMSTERSRVDTSSMSTESLTSSSSFQKATAAFSHDQNRSVSPESTSSQASAARLKTRESQSPSGRPRLPSPSAPSAMSRSKSDDV